MTEADYLACTDPEAMLRFLKGNGSDRKLRLFACGCLRQVWHLLTNAASRRAVETAERYADGQATDKERHQAYVDSAKLYSASTAKILGARHDAAMTCLIRASTSVPPLATSHEIQVALLRDVFGNPFRPLIVTERVPSRWPGREYAFQPSWLDWHDYTIPRLAEAIYQERAWERLPILADALEESGCTEESLLRHCRGQEPCPYCFAGRQITVAVQGMIAKAKARGATASLGSATVVCSECADGWIPLRGPHVRGCWALDLLTDRR